MLGSLLITFREVLEAGLVVGIVLAATQGVARRGRWLAGGVLAGVLGAAVVAAGAGWIADQMDGAGQDVFNAAVLAVAAAMLGGHTIWMARHGRQVAAEMAALGRAVATGDRTLPALAAVVGLAVLREGAEIVLFLYGILAGGGDTAASLAAGIALGLLAGVALSWLLYAGLLRIPPRLLFAVTGGLLTLLAAGMAAQSARFAVSAGLLPASRTVWDSSWLLAEASVPGRALHALLGYRDHPALLEIAAWLGTLTALLLGSRAFAPAPRPPARLHRP